MKPPRPLCLIILDGFGIRLNDTANAISQANTPFWDSLWETYPHTTLKASGEAVGLPADQMGNSEVGHLTMGAGRVIEQDLVRISKAMESGVFKKNPIILNAFHRAKKENLRIHLLGLLSPGGVHSHEAHWFSLLAFAKEFGVPQLILHPFLDGRDTPPKSAESSLQILQTFCDQTTKIGSLSGRYYAMDRDKRFDRTQRVYELLTENKASFQADTAADALHAAYDRCETDEFVSPTLINNATSIQDNDIVIFLNFRADRARQLTHAFCDPHFTGFKRNKHPHLAEFLTLTEYEKKLPVNIIFPPVSLSNTLGDILEQKGLKQLRIAETEKYAHVTFFFNGGREIPFKGEDRVLIPSPKVATYDLCPEMSALELTNQVIKLIQQNLYDVIILNYANADMLGHTGHFEATRKGIEALDDCLSDLIPAIQAAGGEAVITADHGNAECMFDEKTNQPHTAHTTEEVPFIFVGRKAKISHDSGTLADIAPTLLSLLSLPIPSDMSGTSLVTLC